MLPRPRQSRQRMTGECIASSSNEASQTSTDSTDVTRAFPKDMYYVHKNGTEDPPLELEKWLYPREAYIFLHFDNRHYPVARSLISDLTALTSSTYFKDKVFLQLPQGTSEGDFLTFYFFLVHGMYPPYFKALNAESTSFEPTRRGPPKIQSYDARAPTYLNRLVSAFQLGTVLQYRPFRDFALKGLYSLESTAEDPVTVLEQVYCRRNSLQHLAAPASIEAPDAQLRVWARRWLAVENDAPGSGQHVARSHCNLGVVRSHPRYEPLRASCFELAEDDDTTVKEVAYKHRNNNVVRLESPMLSPAPSLLTSQPRRVPLLRPLNLPSRIIYPTTLPPRHFPNSSCFPPGESRTSVDMSSMLPNLPSDYFQYPHHGLGVPPESFTDAEAYHQWMLQRNSKDEEVRNWLSQQRNNSYDVIYQHGLPSLEKSRRPY